MTQMARIPTSTPGRPTCMAWLDRRVADMLAAQSSLSALKIMDDPEALFQIGRLAVVRRRRARAGFDYVQRAVARGYYVAPTLERRARSSTPLATSRRSKVILAADARAARARSPRSATPAASASSDDDEDAGACAGQGGDPAAAEDHPRQRARADGADVVASDDLPSERLVPGRDRRQTREHRRPAHGSGPSSSGSRSTRRAMAAWSSDATGDRSGGWRNTAADFATDLAQLEALVELVTTRTTPSRTRASDFGPMSEGRRGCAGPTCTWIITCGSSGARSEPVHDSLLSCPAVARTSHAPQRSRHDERGRRRSQQPPRQDWPARRTASSSCAGGDRDRDRLSLGRAASGPHRHRRPTIWSAKDVSAADAHA